MRQGKQRPLDDLGLPPFKLPKEEWDNFMAETEFMDLYRRRVQAVFWNLVALAVIALICFGGLSIVYANTQREYSADLTNMSYTEHAPWWAIVLGTFVGVVFVVATLYFGKNLLFLVYWSITRLPRYLRGMWIRRNLIVKLRSESMAWDEAAAEELMNKVVKELEERDPKTVAEMRKAGLL